MAKEVTYGFPTHIEKTGELLKICLQKDHKLALFVEGYLLKYIDEIRSVRYIPNKEDLHPGIICIGQYDDQQYYRIKVLDQSIQNQIVNVLFIDYGNLATLALSDIRLLSYDHNTLLNIPPLAVTCFLEGVNVVKQWNDEELSTLKKFILYEERQCVFRQLSDVITVVNIYIASTNKYLNSMIIENDLGTPISDSKLIIIAKGMMPSGLPFSDRSDQNRLRLLQQKANEQQTYGQMMSQFEQMNYHTERLQMPDPTSSMQILNIGTTHHVYVSHMEEGPFSFFVQLKTNAEDALPRLTNLLKQQKPVPHTPPLMPGSMVMTHVLCDNSYRRSIVMNIRHDSCLVYHMDFGNTEDIPCSEIYQLPPQARHAPAMALRFCLSEMKSQLVTDSAKAYFQEFLERKCVLIRVVHEEQDNPLYQYCEMFYDNKNVKEILWTFNSPLEYTNQLHPRGKDVKVTVSVVESPAQFYVQYASKLDIISNIQEAVNTYCISQPRLQDLSSVSIGSPVAAFFEDNTWYRAMVVGINNDSVKVLYVDYGNRSDVHFNHLCQISRELVTTWRMQAVECCLVGFENCGEVSEAVKEKMINKTLGLTYHLRLMSILNSSRLLVDLIDNLGGKVSDDIKYSSPSQIIPPYREKPPFFQKSKEQTSVSSGLNVDPTSMRNKYRTDTSVGIYNDTPKSAYQYFCESEEQKGKLKNDNVFSRLGQRQTPFHLESSYSEHDNRDVDYNKNRGYNRQKSFDKGSRFKMDDGPKKSTDNFEEEKQRRNRFGDDRGSRGSVGSRGSDDLISDERPRRGYGGPRSRPDDDKASDQYSDDKPRRGGFNRQRDDDKGSEQMSDDRPRKPFIVRSRTDDDKASDQFVDDKPQRGFRGQRQDEDRRGFGSNRDRFNKGNNWETGDDNHDRRGGRRGDEERRGGRGEDNFERRGGRGEDNFERRGGRGEDNFERRGGRGDDNFERRGGRGEDNFERRGGRGEDNFERRGGRGEDNFERRGRGGGNRWGGDGDSEDRPRRDGNRRGDWKKEDGGEERRGGERWGGGGPRRFNRSKEDGGSGGWTGDTRKKRFDNDSGSSKRFSADVSSDFGAKNIAAVTDEWEDTTSDSARPPVALSNAVIAYSMLQVLPNSELKVHLSYMQNPHLFYVQPDGSEGDLDEIRAIIEAETEVSLVPVKEIMSLPLGTPVLARFSEDQLLYRGLIQQIFPPSSAQVLFIDYGNFDTVEINNLYLVSTKLAQKPPVSMRCSLVDVTPTEAGWAADPDEYSKYFEADEAMKITVESTKMLDGQLVVYVKLTTPSGEQVSQLLAQSGLAINIGKSCSTPSEESSVPNFEKLQEPAGLQGHPSPADVPVPEHVPGKIKESLPDKWVDRFDLLVGQKFYCTVLETIEENLFIISITEAKVIALAAISPDLQHIPILAPKTNLITEVKAVEDDRLKVLFYDLNGNQIKPKEGTTTRRLNPICPFPVIRRLDHVTVTHSEGAVVYIQRICDADRLGQLFDDMYTHYESTKPDPEAHWKIGDTCAAKSVMDSNWYRARLINGPKDHTVRYLDYGSTEELPPENLRKLDEQFVFSELCLNVFLSVYWRTPNPPFLLVVEGEELYAKFARDFNGKWIVDLTFANGEKVTQKLIENNIATEKTESPFHDQNIIIGSDLTAGDSVPIVVSHEDSITKFWAQMIKHMNNIDELQDKLQNIIENLNEGKPDELKVFAAQYSEDNIWYRAIKVDENTLRFIDYGNTDSISKPVKELPVEIMKPASGFAIPMYLCVKPINGEWSEKAIEIHQTFIEKPLIVAEVINVDYKIIVDVKAEGKLLSEALIEAGFAEYYDYIPDAIKKYLKDNVPTVESLKSSAIQPVSVTGLGKTDDKYAEYKPPVAESREDRCPEIGEHEKVFVVLPNSLNDFYIQEELKTDTLDEIQNRLLTVVLVKYTGIVEVGQMFGVQFQEDDLWYRAKVISTQPKVQVAFIDYGNIVTTSDLRILPEDVVSTPPLAIHCSFDIKETPELLSSFLKITSFGQTPFYIKFKSFGTPNIVSLLTEEGRDVLEIILSLNKIEFHEAEKQPLEEPEKLIEQVLGDIEDQEVIEECTLSHTSLHEEIEEGLRITMELLEPELNVVKQGYISHIGSINDFYIQEISVMSLLDQINDIFSVFEGNHNIKEDFKLGDLVAAKYIDEGWYRGVVVQTEPEVIVQFIDYGNENIVNEVFDLPKSLRNLPPAAIKCCLSVDDYILHQNAEEKFLEISGGGSTLFDFKILSKNGNMKIVELMVDSKNILLDLTEDSSISDRKESSDAINEVKLDSLTEGHISAKNSSGENHDNLCELVENPNNLVECPTTIGDFISADIVNKEPVANSDFIKVYISYAKGPYDFYVHMVTAEYQLVDKVLNEADNCNEVLKANVGDKVIVKSENGKWYRGKVLECNESSYQLFLLDSGEVITSNDLKQLPTELEVIPTSVLHCSLQLPESVTIWPQEAAAEFLRIHKNIIIDSYEILDKIVDPCIVKLATDDGDLTTILKKFCSLELEISPNNSNIEDQNFDRVFENGQENNVVKSKGLEETENTIPELSEVEVTPELSIRDDIDVSVESGKQPEEDNYPKNNLRNDNYIPDNAKDLSVTEPTPEISVDINLDVSVGAKGQTEDDIDQKSVMKEINLSLPEPTAEIFVGNNLDISVEAKGQTEDDIDHKSVIKEINNLSVTEPTAEISVDSNLDVSVVAKRQTEDDIGHKSVIKEINGTDECSAKKVVVNKPIKTLAEIKASAKPKIVTRLSKTPDRLSSNKLAKPAPVAKVKSEPHLDGEKSLSPVNDTKTKRFLPRAHSLNIDERPVPGSLSQPPSPDLNSRPQQSKFDKIIPGAVSGVNMSDLDQD